MRELYDDLQSSVIELENKWGDDIDDDCSYMDFIQATEDLQSFYDKHHLILDGYDKDNGCSYNDFISVSLELQSLYDKHHLILDK